MRPPPLDRASALFVDVDGTLLEIAPRPELVQVPHALPELLARLAAERGGAMALVSGRRLADLNRLFSPWRGAAAGLHGAEIRRPDGRCLRGENAGDAAAAAIDRLRPRLADWAGRRPGIALEDKGRTLALHYRGAPARAAEVSEFAAGLLREVGGSLRLIAGKMVVELLPRGCGKDGAIAAFLAEPPFCGRRPVFLGDDVTDEDGFAEINRRGGLSVRVGARGPETAAAYALPSVAATLRWLAAAGLN
ncbi:MAG TPA: trehalose-phosphatase [Stellaceae bacterium]|nr:trehalose-phosphatase [Stellaceae bacterium]